MTGRATSREPAAAAAQRLITTRARTWATLDTVDGEALARVHTPLLSPIIWDLAHIAAFADLWLARVLGRPLLHEELAATYDAGLTPRAQRGALPLLDLAAARDYLARVEDALLGALPGLDLAPDAADPLLRDGYLIDLLVEHEEQHRETMLQALHIAEPGTIAVGPPAAWAERPADGPLMVDVPAQQVTIGCATGFGYDNERPAHAVELGAFKIDRSPVTVEAFATFVADGGYDDERLWSAEGWSWRHAEQVGAPLMWQPDGTVRRFDRFELPLPGTPVMNVSCHEADAFARWRGARLPTEWEWEAAARGPGSAARPAPWGEGAPRREVANVDGDAWGALPPRAASSAPCGALAMIGDVWEWTASPLTPYPGFRAFPYPEYSEVFFDGPYRVLRGGSWATAGCCARVSFRNWDFPQRRQIFSGLRCATDA